MKKGKLIFAVTICLLMAASLCSCGTSGVAAKVNGKSISEEDVTARIMATRAAMGAEGDDKAWAEVLRSVGKTPKTLRDEIIELYVGWQLIRDAAASEGVKVDAAAIDEKLKAAKQLYGGDEQAWIESLNHMYYADEDAFRKYLEVQYLDERLMDKLYPLTPLSEEDADAYVLANVPNLGKRSSLIFISANNIDTSGVGDVPAVDADDSAAKSDEATETDDAPSAPGAAYSDVEKALYEKAARIRSEWEAGADFRDLVETYSEDPTTAGRDGDAGWSGLVPREDAYDEALAALQPDQVSPPVLVPQGVYLILCTEVFNPAGESGRLSISDIPPEIVEQIKQQQSSNEQAARYLGYLTSLREKATVNIKPMPKKVPYNVDMDV